MNTTRGLPVRSLQAELPPLLEAGFLNVCHSDCPLFELQNMAGEARQQWLAALTREELMFLAAYHHVCQQVTLELRLVQSAGMIRDGAAYHQLPAAHPRH